MVEILRTSAKYIAGTLVAVKISGTCHIFFIMSSQLPNVGGMFSFHNYGVNSIKVWQTYGVFGKQNHDTNKMHVSGNTHHNNYEPSHVDIDLSRGSNIYKNGVTQVFGDSLSYNIFIKALL